jgi:hypothetical protein
MNRVAGRQGSTRPCLSHLNVSPIQSRKAANNCPRQELHGQYLNQGVVIWMGNVRLPMDLLFQSSDAWYPTKSYMRELSQPKNT